MLFGIYALFSLILAVMGIRVFENITHSADSNNEIRSSLFYTANKIRSTNAGSVYLEQRDGIEVLILETTFSDDPYETLLYYDNGAIKELLMKKGDVFSADMGDTIIETGGLQFSQTGGLIHITITAYDGKTYSMSVYAQSH